MRERMKTLEAQVKSQGQGTKTGTAPATGKFDTDVDPKTATKKGLEKLADEAIKKKFFDKGLPNPKDPQKPGTPTPKAPKDSHALLRWRRRWRSSATTPATRTRSAAVEEALRALKGQEKKGTKGGPEQ